MARRLKGAVVVVTGASSGIGRAAALEFARRGARVVVAARREDPLDEVANACRDAGGEALAVPTDVTDEPAAHRPGNLFSPMRRGTGARGGWTDGEESRWVGFGLASLVVLVPAAPAVWAAIREPAASASE